MFDFIYIEEIKYYKMVVRNIIQFDNGFWYICYFLFFVSFGVDLGFGVFWICEVVVDGFLMYKWLKNKKVIRNYFIKYF